MIQNTPDKTGQAPLEAIILAGGKGTRLQSVSGDTPKPMMKIGGRPFIEYLLQKLHDSGIRRTILALGYKPENFRSYFGSDFNGMSLNYSIEDAPLGTGGALKKALRYADSENLIVLNGDSYFNVDISSIFTYHVDSSSAITIALKLLDDCSRYGTVSVSNNKVMSFREKGFSGSGYINGGMYVVNRSIFYNMSPDRAFSFETDILEKSIRDIMILPYASKGYFIDIGTPEDYRKAEIELSGQLDTAK